MTRSRNILMEEFSSNVSRLRTDSRLGMPIGLGTNADSSAALHPLEELAMLAGRRANAKRQKALAEWAASPYYELRQVAPGSKGVIGELLTKALFEQVFDLRVEDAWEESGGQVRPATRYDEMIERLGSNDSKLSTRGDNGYFKFAAINPADEQYAMLWGVSPTKITGWLIPTQDLSKLLAAKKSGAAVTGISLNSRGEFSVNIKVDNPPAWLTPYGGNEAQLRSRVELELN